MINPDFSHEKELWDSGKKIVLGADEVGRGSFAGPVVAATCAFSPRIIKIIKKVPKLVIRDSKMMTALQRDKANNWIVNSSLTHGVGEVKVGEINELGIMKATHLAFRKAIRIAENKLQERAHYLLIDAITIPFDGNKETSGKGKSVLENQLAITKGDQKSFSIAAASIVAKVYRDNLMKKLGLKDKYTKYMWYQNKGYGTKQHREAILKHGITPHHRRQFIASYFRNIRS